MMLQSTDKRKIYFYLFLFIILLSIHNINSIEKFDKFFKIKSINLKSDIEDKLNKEITNSLNQFYNRNIFSLSINEISNIFRKYNIISEFKVRKKYPASIDIELKKTNILAYYISDNKKIYLGENGKQIKKNNINYNPPLIVGDIKIEKFIGLKNNLTKQGFIFENFNKFYYFKSERWDLLYKNKLLIKLPSNNLEKSLSILKDIIEKINIDKIRIIDLRVGETIILS
tara:strand:+ start:2146 stop:2829 length:684 start_codon:yes stop_codon:yes gene_type:complete